MLDFQMDLFDAVGLPRIHHQLLPNKVGVEAGFDPRIVEDLLKLGHQVGCVYTCL